MALNKAKVITITSVKGGVGKTTTVLNLAGMYSKMNKKVLVVDLDFYSGDIAASLNIHYENDIYNLFEDDVYISIMSQYVPMYNAIKYPEINKKLNPKHYDALINYATDIGIVNGFIQDADSATTEYTPDFNLQGVHIENTPNR